MTAGTDAIDSRALMLWALAAMAPVLIGRNPLVIGEILVITVVVRTAWAARIRVAGLGWFLRLGAVVLLISVIFNVLTVHAGDRVLARLPGDWPVIGGPLTANALVYGFVSALALFTLLLIGTTTGALLSWMELFRLLPRRLAPIAVAGSVTWAFLPHTATAFRQIREAQTLRGHRVRTGRDVLPLIMPLFAGGLERSLTTAEALEARGFGASLTQADEPERTSWSLRLGMVIALVALAAGAYCLLVGFGIAATALLIGGASMLLAIVALPARDGTGAPRTRRRTRYQDVAWHREDTIVSGLAVLVLIVVVSRNIISPVSFRFEPYPMLTFPRSDPVLMVVLAALLAPALFAPTGDPMDSGNDR